MKKTVLILGNGKSRTRLHNFILSWEHEVWVCNEAYQEAQYYKNVTRIGTVHNDLVYKMNHFAKKNKVDYEVWVKNNKNLKAKAFTKPRGWSTGNELLQQALIEKYDKILLAGFDMGGGDIYQSHLLIGTNFVNQLNRIKDEYNCDNVYFLNEIGEEVPIVSVKVTNNKADNTKPIKEIIPIGYKDKKCIIIGNGTSIINEPLGDTIDSYDIVVRINDFHIKGFENYTGEKTTFWFSGVGNQTKIKRNPLNIQKCFAMFPLSLHNLPIEQLKQKISLRLGFNAVSKFHVVEKDHLKKLITISNIRYPSTGLLAILYCKYILGIKDITIHGFDFFENPLHYYDSKDMTIRISNEHTFEKEKEFIMNLVKQGGLSEISISDIVG